MNSYLLLKHFHMGFAVLSVAGFALRGVWMLSGSAMLQAKLVKILPHVVDTLLLLTAVLMLVRLGLSPGEAPWVMAKLIGLLVYIGLGLVALRLGRTRPVRLAAFVGALVTAGYLFSVAYSKNPWGPLAGLV